MFDSIRTDSRPRRRAIAGLLAATAIAGVVAASATSAAAAPATSHAASHAVTARSAADVPWSKVGSGWMVATWARTAKSAATVYLIAPGGTRYAMTQVSQQARIIDWTTARGGRLLIDYYPLGVREVNLRTGARHTIGRLPYEISGYARPGATGVLALDNNGRLVEFGLDGKRRVSFPASVRGSGALNSRHPVSVRTRDALVVGARHGLVELSGKGAVLRRLSTGLNDCSAQSLLRKGVVVARCGKGVLYAVSLAGGRATQLTSGPDKQNPFGYADIWSTSHARLGTSPNGCGPSSLVRYDAAGRGTRFVPPSPISGQGQQSYFGHYGDVVEATVHHGGCMDATTTLFTWNAVTGRSTVLLGPGANGGNVVDVAPNAFDVATEY